MKKTYIAPEVKTFVVEVTQMLTQSLSTNDLKLNNSEDIHVNSNNWNIWGGE